MQPDFHAVKVAAISDALQAFGVTKESAARPALLQRGLDAAKNGAKWLFSRHQPAMEKGLWDRVSDARLRKRFVNPNVSVMSEVVPGLKATGKNVAKQVGEVLREGVFGSPITLAKNLQERHIGNGSWTRSLAEHAKEFYLPKGGGVFGAGLSMAFPAYEGYQLATKGDPDHRGSDYAAFAASLATSPFSAHLGIPGMLLQAPVIQAARQLGSHFDAKPTATPYANAYNPSSHPRNVLRGMNGQYPIPGGLGDTSAAGSISG